MIFNISTAINFNSDDGLFYGKIHLSVKNNSHLDRVIKKILKIEGVENVNRINEER